VAQGEDLGKQCGVASDQQAKSADEPDHHQVQQSNQHIVDRHRELGNPSSPHVDEFWHGTGCRARRQAPIP
jgi:hypothetical protein